VCVVIPMFNEEDTIGYVLETLPSFVDAVVVVDDGSTDASYQKARAYEPAFPEFLLSRHPKNIGFGAALKSCYRNSLKTNADAMVLMGGDGQMYPGDLPSILDPIVEGSADIVSGDRFSSPYGASGHMPGDRFTLNRLVTWLTSGMTRYQIADAECGYSAMTRRCVAAINWAKMTNGWGIALERLLRLREGEFRLENVPVRAIYIKRKSKLKYLPYFLDYASVSLRLLPLWLRFFAKSTCAPQSIHAAGIHRHMCLSKRQRRKTSA
jgi:glycosyltransferase involved in cell wall biosynthesis